ncbi:MAG TPA: hypothetical protein VEA99_03345 [Gemmatimonadaceae bacterium]|nr:hypothetical protein [Gemmatimonadaceae bacterium]
MRDQDERESPSGAMRGRGEGAGSRDLPYPRTDAEDTGTDDGGLRAGEHGDATPTDEDARRAAEPPRERRPSDGRTDPLGPGRDDDARGADRAHGGWGDEGIGGSRAGGTGM